jgi:hypothetical protein
LFTAEIIRLIVESALSDSDVVVAQLKVVLRKIFSLADTRIGLTPPAALQCVSTWARATAAEPQRAWSSLARFRDVLADFLLFGPVHHKFTRNLSDTGGTQDQGAGQRD